MNNVRLSKTEVTSIQTTFKNTFLKQDQLWLFGSKANLNAKGGDIDLYIETQINDLQEIIDKKLEFITALKTQIGEQKIDIVVNYNGSTKLPIYKFAKQEGVQLI